ncbi:MAG: peptide/nickel transport system substrate-binding protein [Candidatus Binatota bacterium]|nr:peptide/nickel transport system substrate-binding protein [Candidatus Binatota bacterium]
MKLLSRTMVMFTAAAWFLCSGVAASAQTRVSIGVTETIETYNPYGDSVSLLYGIFSEVTGPFCTYNYAKGDFEGRLAERWKIENPTTWIFFLSKNYKFNDGTPVTADDVSHSLMNRVINDPQSKQKATVAPSVTKAEAIDKFTVKITTDKPTAPLLSFLCDRLIVTSKAAFDKYGRDVADKEHMMGGGPYRLKELIPGQRLVLQKRPDHPDAKKNPRAPDEVVYRIMRETEQRVTALLTDEIQIAQFIPPHLRQRVEKTANLRITPVDSVEIMFLAMQPKPPFDKKEVRQAVCHAINRDQIIATLLEGFASRLDGPLGPGQYGYDPELKPKMNYDPERAKKLLAQAGYPNGVDIELQTPVGRYTLYKQLTEAMIPMLNAAGFRAKLLTPEWATLWASVQKGTIPFYYMGRGSVQDPSAALHQYFHSGETPRIGYVNPKLDEFLDKEQAELDSKKRRQYLSQAMSILTEDAPACFMWRHKLLWGLSNKVEYKPLPDARIYAIDMAVKR